MLVISLGPIDSYLPTQIKSFEHIKYLIQKNNPIIIIARAESYWLDAIPELENIDYNTNFNIKVKYNDIILDYNLLNNCMYNFLFLYLLFQM